MAALRALHVLCVPKLHRISRLSLSSVRGSFSGGNNSNPPDNPDDGDQIFTIEEVNFEQQWEENPEFDYTSLVPVPRSYQFIRDQELFDLDELQTLLKEEGVRNLVFMKLPSNHVCKYMAIGSGVSASHVRSAAVLVYKSLKYKRRSSSLGLPRVEGLDGSGDWIVINLNNILLNLFIPSVREHYDLESLWIAGPEYDQQSCNPTPSQQSTNFVDWDQLVADVQRKKTTRTHMTGSVD